MCDVQILTVDDDPHLARLVTLVLQRAGATVAFASTRRDAMRKIREAIKRGRMYDVILTDLNLGKKKSEPLIRWIRLQMQLEAPILVYSGDREIAERVRALNGLVLDYIGVPFEFDDLLRVVSNALRSIGKALPEDGRGA